MSKGLSFDYYKKYYMNYYMAVILYDSYTNPFHNSFKDECKHSCLHIKKVLLGSKSLKDWNNLYLIYRSTYKWKQVYIQVFTSYNSKKQNSCREYNDLRTQETYEDV